ncbi:MAG: NAD(P)/FAD-dependent oxidoreductase [Fibrobacterales bacterium]
MDQYDVIIVGAGAAGLMCAWEAGKRGRSVLILDKGKKPGRKILMSGGGKCNFTNLFAEPSNFVSNNEHFCKSALKRYTQYDFLELIEKNSIPYEERLHGQLFCTVSAKDISNLLIDLCQSAGVEIACKYEVTAIESLPETEADRPQYRIETVEGDFTTQSVVIATGGLSIPGVGACDYGHTIAKQFGLAVTPLQAGLVPFMFSDKLKELFSNVSGFALDVVMGTDSISFRENVLFTHRGLSGPVSLQVSNYWSPGEDIYMNLFPDTSMSYWLIEAKKSTPKTLVRNLLTKSLTKKMVGELESFFWYEWKEQPIAQIPDSVLETLGNHLNHWVLKPCGTEGYRTAEVTRGGVDTNELSSKTMESKKQSGLYFIGEVVDVTGHLGGFNLQWAWSSGFAAGQFV